MGPIRLFVALSLLFSTGQGRSLQARKTRQSKTTTTFTAQQMALFVAANRF